MKCKIRHLSTCEQHLKKFHFDKLHATVHALLRRLDSLWWKIFTAQNFCTLVSDSKNFSRKKLTNEIFLQNCEPDVKAIVSVRYVDG